MPHRTGSRASLGRAPLTSRRATLCTVVVCRPRLSAVSAMEVLSTAPCGPGVIVCCRSGVVQLRVRALTQNRTCSTPTHTLCYTGAATHCLWTKHILLGDSELCRVVCARARRALPGPNAVACARGARSFPPCLTVCMSVCLSGIFRERACVSTHRNQKDLTSRFFLGIDNKKRFLAVGKLKRSSEVNGFKRLWTAVIRRQGRRKKLGPFWALRSVGVRNRPLQPNSRQPQPQNELIFV